MPRVRPTEGTLGLDDDGSTDYKSHMGSRDPFFPYLAGVLVVTLALTSCGGDDDTSGLRTQVAALQTQVALPTGTLSATVSPTPTTILPPTAEPTATTVPPTPTARTVFVPQPTETPTVAKLGRTLSCTNLVLSGTNYATEEFTLQNRATGMIFKVSARDGSRLLFPVVGNCYPEEGTPNCDPGPTLAACKAR